MKMVTIPYWMAAKIRDYCGNSHSCDFCIFGGKCRDYHEYPENWSLAAKSVKDEDDGNN